MFNCSFTVTIYFKNHQLSNCRLSVKKFANDTVFHMFLKMQFKKPNVIVLSRYCVRLRWLMNTKKWVVNRKALALFLKSKLETYKIPLLYSTIDKVERTFNGKINRKYYINSDFWLIFINYGKEDLDCIAKTSIFAKNIHY